MNPLLRHQSRLAHAVLRTETDQRLAALARGGSAEAFELIVERHRGPLTRHCRGIVGDADAEEAVQNALIKAHGALARGDRVRHLGPWLHTIAHHAAINILRARAARPESPSTGRELLDVGDDSPQHRERLEEVLGAVQSLPWRQRDAIVMRELEGLTYAQIASRLGATNGAVRQLLGRARRTMRERLGAAPLDGTVVLANPPTEEFAE
jgi:RNA polymerase sigma factor (sigma-70 family)